MNECGFKEIKLKQMNPIETMLNPVKSSETKWDQVKPDETK